MFSSVIGNCRKGCINISGIRLDKFRWKISVFFFPVNSSALDELEQRPELCLSWKNKFESFFGHIMWSPRRRRHRTLNFAASRILYSVFCSVTSFTSRLFEFEHGISVIRYPKLRIWSMKNWNRNTHVQDKFVVRVQNVCLFSTVRQEISLKAYTVCQRNIHLALRNCGSDYCASVRASVRVY